MRSTDPPRRSRACVRIFAADAAASFCLATLCRPARPIGSVERSRLWPLRLGTPALLHTVLDTAAKTRGRKAGVGLVAHFKTVGLHVVAVLLPPSGRALRGTRTRVGRGVGEGGATGCSPSRAHARRWV